MSAPTDPGALPRTPPAARRRGPERADALADAVTTPSFPSKGRNRPRAKGRRVRRVVRRVELWSVLKVAIVFNTVMLGIVIGAVAVLWGLANTTGLVGDLEGFLRDAGFEDFRFQGDRMFRQVAFIGAVVALAASVFVVLAAALVNLISEVTGGIRFVVIEEIVEDGRIEAVAPVEGRAEADLEPPAFVTEVPPTVAAPTAPPGSPAAGATPRRPSGGRGPASGAGGARPH